MERKKGEKEEQRVQETALNLATVLPVTLWVLVRRGVVAGVNGDTHRLGVTLEGIVLGAPVTWTHNYTGK